MAQSGFTTSCCVFSIAFAPSSGVRTVTGNSVDLVTFWDGAINITATSNYFGGGVVLNGAAAWPDDTYFHTNFIGGTAMTGTPGAGSIKDCYFCNVPGNSSAWAHFVASATVKNCLFENSTSGGSYLYGAGALSVIGCIVLPVAGAGNISSGRLIFGQATPAGPYTVEHCAQIGDDGNAGNGMISLGAGGAAYIGQVASFQANIVACAVSDNYTLGITEKTGSTFTVDAVTVADYNVFRNGTVVGNCKYNTTTTVASPYGYYQLAVSNASAFRNAQVGLHDSAQVVDPQFVDGHRCVKQWGVDVRGVANTYAAAMGELATDPTLILSMMHWVRSGYVPLNTALWGATYPGDTLTLDANGNPLRGTIGPMAYPTGGGAASLAAS